MLRNSNIRQQVAQPFICWRCLTRPYQTSSHGQRRKDSGARATSLEVERCRWRTSRRSFSGSPGSRASTEDTLIISRTGEVPPIESPPDRPNIRERLRQWQVENPAKHFQPPEFFNTFQAEDVVNTMTRPNTNDFRVETDEEDARDDSLRQPMFDEHGLIDVGSNRKFLLPGDLVDLMAVGSRQHELAIMVQEISNVQTQFYTMSGRWIHRTGHSAKFFVPKFVESHELDEIRPYLPQASVSASMENKLQSLASALPRDVGKPLLKKMASFLAQADAAYQIAAPRLDNAHSIVAHRSRFAYATLEELADQLLSKILPKIDDGKFSKPILYAVHRALLQYDVGFRAQSKGVLRLGGQYEINSLEEVATISNVTESVRAYQDVQLNGNTRSHAETLRTFAKNARRLIDISRRNREFTPHGTIGLSSIKSQKKDPLGAQSFRFGEERETFAPDDLPFIRFLESWAGLGTVTKRSSLNSIGSTILRAIGRYSNVELDKTTAWTCLQEIGAIPPWESLASYELRLPNTGRKLQSESAYPRFIEGQLDVDDKIMHLRKDWGDLPVFCIDDATAQEIDDGMSVEATDVPDEYWVHIHTADPAAHIDPKGPAARYAELLTETIYFPERRVAMLNPTFTQARLSLAPGRPCLTFSARINLSAELLESKITPGIIRNVQYLTPEVFQEINGLPPYKYSTYVVGPNRPAKPFSRKLLKSHDIAEAWKRDLEVLHKLGMARTRLQLSRGATITGAPEALISVSFGGAQWSKVKSFLSCDYYGDPTISCVIQEDMTVQGRQTTVGPLMLLAGEIAGQWCKARGVPIPYRITPRNPDKEDPRDFFHRVLEPLLEKNEFPTIDIMQQYFGLIGIVQPSTSPGLHVGVGFEGMTKCTSPLRRFPDLLVHWQIEAALLEEARSGKALNGNTKEDFLPFNKLQIEALLPRLDSRERLISHFYRVAHRQWQCHFLLRAWKYGEAKLPTPLTFSARSVDTTSQLVGGVVEDLFVGGQMPIPGWTTAAEIKVGDKFEVVIEDINAYALTIGFKALRSIDS